MAYMTPSLPEGFTLRAASQDDAEAILAVGIARDIADVGEPDWSLEDVREEMADARAVEVVEDEAGAVVAFVFLHDEEGRVNVHPEATGRGIGDFLREHLEGLARKAGARELRQQIFGADDAARALLREAGYVADQHFWRMVRELDGSESEPVWPEGAEPRPFDAARDERPAHELVQDAFTDIPGNVTRPFDEWRPRAYGAQFAPQLATVAGDMSGVALAERWEGTDGYLSYLAVARGWRGRGLGRALLQGTLRKFADAGLKRGVLGVNAGNESATELYRSVGMEVTFRADRFVKQLA
jgi:mycothiol synthase